MISGSKVLRLLCLTAGLAGCASTPPAPMALGCRSGEHSARVVQLFFDRNIGTAPGVSEADFDAFLEREISPRFPQGASVIDTAGVRRGPGGAAVHELGKAVVIVLRGQGDDSERVKAVRAAYKTRFSQDSVLTARNRACVAF
jgi:hypothetical protein